MPRYSYTKHRPQPVRKAHKLLDRIRSEFRLLSDYAVARELGLLTTTISRIRAGVRPITDEGILAVHDFTNWPIREIKALAKESMNESEKGPPAKEYSTESLHLHRFLRPRAAGYVGPATVSSRKRKGHSKADETHCQGEET